MRSLFALAVIGLLVAGACRSSTAEPPEASATDAGSVDAGPTSKDQPDGSAPSTEDAGKPPSIGSSGGAVVSADGRARIAVPASAVTTETSISITPVPTADVPRASGAYDFGPAGLSFAKDARICLDIDGTPDLSTSCLGYLAGDGKWVCEDPCLQKEGAGLCGSTDHFTNFAILLTGGRGPDASCDDAVFTALGGTLASPDGLATVTAPAGALKAKTRITIARAPAPADVTPFASEVFDLLPDGTSFAAKVDLCITPKADAKLEGACLGYQNKDKKWVCEDPCLEQKGDRLCGTTDHFTSFAILLTGGKGTSCTN